LCDQVEDAVAGRLPRLRSREFAAQQTEAGIGVDVLNRMLAAARPNSLRSQKVAA